VNRQRLEIVPLAKAAHYDTLLPAEIVRRPLAWAR
jgi:hypothetical protein